MPTWYWVIFTIITLIRPILCIINTYIEDEIKNEIKELSKETLDK
jgi:hypothetical protein